MSNVSEMTSDDLMALAKKIGITDAASYEKAALALAVIAKQQEQEGVNEVDDERPDTEAYLEIAPAGTLVAYWNNKGCLKSAAIMSRNSSQRLVKLETKYGCQMVVSFDDVEWVKTGSSGIQRWSLQKEKPFLPKE